eukprot:11814083-Alexandrium_andersonii.AAC.1
MARVAFAPSPQLRAVVRQAPRDLSDLGRSVAVASDPVAARSQRRSIERNAPRCCFKSSDPVASRSHAP